MLRGVNVWVWSIPASGQLAAIYLVLANLALQKKSPHVLFGWLLLEDMVIDSGLFMAVRECRFAVSLPFHLVEWVILMVERVVLLNSAVVLGSVNAIQIKRNDRVISEDSSSPLWSEMA